MITSNDEIGLAFNISTLMKLVRFHYVDLYAMFGEYHSEIITPVVFEPEDHYDLFIQIIEDRHTRHLEWKEALRFSIKSMRFTDEMFQITGTINIIDTSTSGYMDLIVIEATPVTISFNQGYREEDWYDFMNIDFKIIPSSRATIMDHRWKTSVTEKQLLSDGLIDRTYKCGLVTMNKNFYTISPTIIYSHVIKYNHTMSVDYKKRNII